MGQLKYQKTLTTFSSFLFSSAIDNCNKFLPLPEAPLPPAEPAVELSPEPLTTVKV